MACGVKQPSQNQNRHQVPVLVNCYVRRSFAICKPRKINSIKSTNFAVVNAGLLLTCKVIRRLLFNGEYKQLQAVKTLVTEKTHRVIFMSQILQTIKEFGIDFQLPGNLSLYKASDVIAMARQLVLMQDWLDNNFSQHRICNKAFFVSLIVQGFEFFVRRNPVT